MSLPIVFFDLAGPDADTLRDFYAEVCGWTADDAGKFTVEVRAPFEAAIREDPAEKRIYIGVPDVAEYLALVERAGGSVDVPRFEVRGVVVLGLFRDPAGNPMGFVEMDGDRPRVP